MSTPLDYAEARRSCLDPWGIFSESVDNLLSRDTQDGQTASARFPSRDCFQQIAAPRPTGADAGYQNRHEAHSTYSGGTTSRINVVLADQKVTGNRYPGCLDAR
jgi:hypothetical protein